MTYQEQQYHNLLQRILDDNNLRPSRTGLNNLSTFCPPTMKFELNNGKTFPLLTKKKVSLFNIFDELRWFLNGETNVLKLDTRIWDAWSDQHGEVGPLYGTQLTNKKKMVGGILKKREGFYVEEITFNPLQDIINNIKNNPTSKRHVLTTWEHTVLPDESLSPQENVKRGLQALAPCHGTVIHFYVNDNKLSMRHVQRSGDVPIGIPYNIASYALLLMMVANVCNLEADTLYFDINDAHIYENQLDGVKTYLERDILMDFPSLTLTSKPDKITGFGWKDLLLEGYDPQPHIKFEIAV